MDTVTVRLRVDKSRLADNSEWRRADSAQMVAEWLKSMQRHADWLAGFQTIETTPTVNYVVMPDADSNLPDRNLPLADALAELMIAGHIVDWAETGYREA